MKLLRIMPLYVMVLIVLAQEPVRTLNWQQMMEYDRLLDQVVTTMPIPRTRFQRWAVRKVIEWSDREKLALRKLMDLGVSNIGVLPK